MFRRLRLDLGEALYHIGYSFCLFGSFFLICFLMLFIPFGIPLLIIQYTSGWAVLFWFLVWAMGCVGIVAYMSPWKADTKEFQEKERVYKNEVYQLFPKWFPAYEGNEIPLRFLPFFWLSYCPDCGVRVHIRIWHTFRYGACICGYRWATQDNFIF